MSKRIPRKFVDQFIKQKKLGNIVALLNSLKKKDNLKLFSKDVGGITSVLFHGSAKYSPVLKPSRSGIYATADPNYAIFLAVLRLKNASASVVSGKGKTKLSVDSAFMKGHSSFKDGWVHIVAGDIFKKASNNEYVTHRSIKTLFAIPVKLSDIEVPIEIV